MLSRGRLVCALSLTVLLGATMGSAQMRYWSGQNVVPVFEGWERNADGTFSMVFGYYNRNYEEALDLPVGADNSIEPGGPDQDQPTFFAPARHKYVFRVRVPKDWDKTRKLVWTLTIRGRTDKATAFLLPEWESNDQVMMMNAGGGGVNTTDPNAPPTITVGPSQTIAFPQSASLSATVTDDGLPKRRPPRRRGATGSPSSPPTSMLRVDWLQYRGPVGGRVTFAPASSPVVTGKATTTASFSAPGQYVVRGFANDGALTTSGDIKVTVTTAAPSLPR
jgi:hypothetical protein